MARNNDCSENGSLVPGRPPRVHHVKRRSYRGNTARINSDYKLTLSDEIIEPRLPQPMLLIVVHVAVLLKLEIRYSG